MPRNSISTAEALNRIDDALYLWDHEGTDAQRAALKAVALAIVKLMDEERVPFVAVK
jgi:hypothetical protein